MCGTRFYDEQMKPANIAAQEQYSEEESGASDDELAQALALSMSLKVPL